MTSDNAKGSAGEPIRDVEALRFSEADARPHTDRTQVVVERPFTITVEGIGDFTVMCTPCDLDALAAGFSFSKRMGETPGREEGVAGPPRCGDSLRVPAAVLNGLVAEMRSRQAIFAATGATHAAAVFDADGRIVSFGEDIGRHNAMDKAVGKCLLSNVSTVGCGVVLSGRVSFELVAKAAHAGMELIAAVSAPTSLALDAAERTGITLCAFVREDRATVYTHPQRVVR